MLNKLGNNNNFDQECGLSYQQFLRESVSIILIDLCNLNSSTKYH